VKRKGNSLFGLGTRPLTERVMRSNANMTLVEQLRQWQQHAVSQIQVQRGDFVLISSTAHPLDQTK
jgi:3-phenylpropionate/cinnamic acid dioxygenase small subunit